MGGTLGPTGYSFGPNTGLSLDNVVSQTYSIYISFYFDSFNASLTTWQRILDFQNRLSDSGLYGLNGSLQLFSSVYLPGLPPVIGGNDPHGSSAGQLFSAGVIANLLVTRDATGLFSAYVNGGLAFSVMDPTGSTTFSGLNNRIWFFVDDFQSLFYYPDSPDAGSGFINSIRVSTPEGESLITPVVTPLPAALPLFATGLGALGLLGWRRKQKQVA